MEDNEAPWQELADERKEIPAVYLLPEPDGRDGWQMRYQAQSRIHRLRFKAEPENLGPSHDIFWLQEGIRLF